MMEPCDFRGRLDRELAVLRLSDAQKAAIRARVSPTRRRIALRRALTVAVAVLLLLCATAAAVWVASNQTLVNGTALAELGPLKAVDAAPLGHSPSDTWIYSETSPSYADVQEAMGVTLLNHPLADPSAPAAVETDNIDYNRITVEGYLPASGEEGPLTLTVMMALSETQVEIGFNLEFLGTYEPLPSSVTAQGWPVNYLRRSGVDSPYAEKFAIFVADGIQYRLAGWVTTAYLEDAVNAFA